MLSLRFTVDDAPPGKVVSICNSKSQNKQILEHKPAAPVIYAAKSAVNQLALSVVAGVPYNTWL